MVVNIFLAPKGGKTEKNFIDTVVKGVPYDDISKFLPKDEPFNSILKIWDCSSVSGWRNMKVGDIILFYSRGEYTHYGKVSYKIVNPRLSEYVWKMDEEATHGRVFFLEKNLGEFKKLSSMVVHNLASYNTKSVFSFRKLNDKGLNGIIKAYGSIEDFLKKYEKINNDEEEIDKISGYVYSVQKRAPKGMLEVRIGQTSDLKRRLDKHFYDGYCCNNVYAIGSDLNLNKVEIGIQSLAERYGYKMKGGKSRFELSKDQYRMFIDHLNLLYNRYDNIPEKFKC